MLKKISREVRREREDRRGRRKIIKEQENVEKDK